MLRSEFDNLPVLIVEQIIRGILGHGLAGSWLKEIGTGAVHDHSLVPIMNQTWGRVVDSMANECAELEIAAEDFSASGVSDRSVRNSLRVVIANGHHALLKMFRLDITFARGFYPPIIDYITRLLQGNVFPAASTLLVTIRDEWVAWERPQSGPRGNTIDRSDSQDPSILTHTRRFSADLGMLLKSAFPRVRNLGVEAISTNKEFRLVVIPGDLQFACWYSAAAINRRRNPTEGWCKPLSPAPLQYIKISLLKVELGWAALIRRNAQTLERLFIHTTDSDISLEYSW
ncbi:hypothetical protein DL89DRAFT_54956 [Linderina pennispora]|uniref:Uncharacterized protein n=1 Tax=Linderina pennispora TaxID=61395 RepID=A0A1Y1W157_9FUNG|nr:uncharacterized protein DL89DRAFT_54956 [Linderina pennispora]ORX67228.1 hypothetical protein DL89DRAFT_54956 [Linderina pennispora]